MFVHVSYVYVRGEFECVCARLICVCAESLSVFVRVSYVCAREFECVCARLSYMCASHK